MPDKYELPDCKLHPSYFVLVDSLADTSVDTQEELDNRNKNAPLLRYVESVRRHGHRAAQIDPLDLMDREQVTSIWKYVLRPFGASDTDKISPVGALNPKRYGLDQSTSYQLNGILHVPSTATTPSVPPATAAPERTEAGEGTRTDMRLEEIERHLMGVYVDKIGVEFMHSPVKSERL